MKATDYIAWFLYQRRVRAVFEMSGGMITHLLDSIYLDGKIRIVSVHHEQAAAFAAEACGRITGVPGVALATSGPGATNLVTGIGSCYFDSSPAVFITGQVNRHEQKGDRAIRQLGFQETDIVAIVRPVTKAAWMVRSPEELPVALDEAFRIATSGRPGPVLLDIPMDVQRRGFTACRRSERSTGGPPELSQSSLLPSSRLCGKQSDRSCWWEGACGPGWLRTSFAASPVGWEYPRFTRSWEWTCCPTPTRCVSA